MNFIVNFVQKLEYDRDDIQIDRSILKNVCSIFIRLNDEESNNSQIYKELEVRKN